MLYFLGFAEAWLLLLVGVSCIVLVTIVTIILFIKYVKFHKSYDGKFYGHIFIEFLYLYSDRSMDVA